MKQSKKKKSNKKHKNNSSAIKNKNRKKNNSKAKRKNNTSIINTASKNKITSEIKEKHTNGEIEVKKVNELEKIKDKVIKKLNLLKSKISKIDLKKFFSFIGLKLKEIKDIIIKILNLLKSKISKIDLKKPFNFIGLKLKNIKNIVIKKLNLLKSKINFKKMNKKKTKKLKENKKPSKIKIKKKLSYRTKINLILFSILCLILALILMYPFGITNYKSEASGKILDVPKFSILSEECCMYNATFKSIRSFSSLKVELNTIMKKYKKVTCDGKEYLYNKEEDFTIKDYDIKNGIIFNEFSINYDKGNICEIATTLKRIELLPDDYSLDAAKKDGCYVIEGENEFNVSSYNKFLENIENNKETTLRVVTNNQDDKVIIKDLTYLADGKFKVTYDETREKKEDESNGVIMAYVYENIGIYKNKFYAYNGNNISESMLNTDDVFYLFDILE